MTTSTSTTTTSTVLLSGNLHRFRVPGSPRERVYAQLTLPLETFLRVARTYTYNESNSQGEQRYQNESHSRKISRAMVEGDYTPTELAVGLYPRHEKALVVQDDQFELAINPEARDGQLPVIDGGHRKYSLELLLKKLDEAIADCEPGALKDNLEKQRLDLLAVPIPFMLHLKGGDTKGDFIKLQLGRAVDRTHMQALMLKKAGKNKDDMAMAWAIATEMNRMDGTFFKGLLRFSDTKQLKGQLVKKVPVNSFAQAGSSDLSCSLVGLARVGKMFGMNARDLANLLASTVKAINTDEEYLEKEGYQELTADEMVLTPLDCGGVLGGATLYVGMAICLAYRLGKSGQPLGREDVQLLIESAMATLAESIDGGLDASRKRKLIGSFARRFFKSLEEKKVGGVPGELILSLSGSSYGLDAEAVKKYRKEVESAAKEKAKPKNKKKSKEETQQEAHEEVLDDTELESQDDELSVELATV